MNELFNFFTEIDVTIGDINYGGHLGNDKYLTLFQEARLRYLAQFGCSEMELGEHTSVIMSQAQIDFKAEAFRGDRLKIGVRISKLEKVRFNFEYLILNHDATKVIATGFTTMVGFDYEARKVKKLPERFVTLIKQFENLK